jgi:predicted Fe-Mo cluster-binding NifX family protein
MNWTDPAFEQAMKEQEPANRASFLAHAYRTTAESFEGTTPDEVLLVQIGPDAYLELKNKGIVPIVAIPAAIMNA